LAAEFDSLHDVVDPFAGVFRLNRLLIYTCLFCIASVIIEGVLLWHVSLAATAHAFEIYPDGRAYFVEDRQSRLLPREYEAKYVARHFVESMWGWNSASILNDLAEAVSLCTDPLASKLRVELAESGLVEQARNRDGGIRNEVVFADVSVLEHSRRASRVHIRADVRRYGLAQYAGQPFDERTIDLELRLQAVRRTEQRPNGLEVISIQQQPNATSAPASTSVNQQ
jgi:hypothetical protein